jgi:hypothetical protein
MTDASPWNASPPNTTVAAQRMSEVKNEAKQIVFAPTIDHDAAGLMGSLNVTVKLGYVELRAPFGRVDRLTGKASLPQWSMDATTGEIIPDPGADYTNGGGFPYDRLEEHRIALGHLDGSVDTQLDSFFVPDASLSGAALDQARINIMSYWSPFAASR